MRQTAIRPTRMVSRRPRRIDREAVFKPYEDWLHTRSCVVCGTRINIQGSHVGSGGMGQKRGGAQDQVPMCGIRAAGRVHGCHLEWGGSYGRFEGKSKTWRTFAAWGWRRDCWRAFLAWARAEVRKPELDGDGIEELEACAAAIVSALDRLAPAGEEPRP